MFRQCRADLDQPAQAGHGAVTGATGDRWLRPWGRGFRDALMLPAWVVGLSLMGVGTLARDVGYPVEAAVLSTVLVWAGPSQVLFFASIASGAAWSAIALAIGFASLRFLPMTVALLPLLRRPGQSVAQQMLLAHFVAVTAWSRRCGACRRSRPSSASAISSASPMR